HQPTQKSPSTAAHHLSASTVTPYFFAKPSAAFVPAATDGPEMSECMPIALFATLSINTARRLGDAKQRARCGNGSNELPLRLEARASRNTAAIRSRDFGGSSSVRISTSRLAAPGALAAFFFGTL